MKRTIIPAALAIAVGVAGGFAVRSLSWTAFKVQGTEVVEVRLPTDGVWIGSASAPIVVIEFGSFTCEFCESFALSALEDLVERYVEPGRIRHRWVNVYNTQAHRRLGAAVRCLNDAVGMVPAMLAVYSVPVAERTVQGDSVWAAKLNVDSDWLSSCVERELVSEREFQEWLGVKQLRLKGTPTFLVGIEERERFVGWAVTGYRGLREIERYIRAAEKVVVDRGRK